MEISDIAGTTSITSATSDSGVLGRDEFLKMLIAQLENQDPLNPQDGTEFTAQLAQFSSLEQEIGMRESLEEIAASLGAGTTSTVIDLIGKEVIAETPFIETTGGSSLLRFDLAGRTDTTTLEIRDTNGRVVRSVELGDLSAGVQTWEWDGLTSSGNVAGPGMYEISLTGTSNGNSVEATVLNQGLVSAADLSSPDGLLFLGDIAVPLEGIREVRAPLTVSAGL